MTITVYSLLVPSLAVTIYSTGSLKSGALPDFTDISVLSGMVMTGTSLLKSVLYGTVTVIILFSSSISPMADSGLSNLNL